MDGREWAQTRRTEWAARHATTITDLLAYVKADVPQRLWRLRYWVDDEYLVATLVQNLNVPSRPDQQVPKVQCDLIRPYTHVTSASLSSTVHLSLYGAYDVHQVVAFLALDTIDPDSVDWIDQTPSNSGIVIVDRSLSNMRER